MSEWVKPRPDPGVANWLSQVDEDCVFLSVISLAELQRGVELLPHGRRRDQLATWLAHTLPARFEGRVLLVDAPAATEWGTLMARARAMGAGLSVMDGFIAATAIVNHLMLVTRNMGDFAPLGIELFNPWS